MLGIQDKLIFLDGTGIMMINFVEVIRQNLIPNGVMEQTWKLLSCGGTSSIHGFKCKHSPPKVVGHYFILTTEYRIGC